MGSTGVFKTEDVNKAAVEEPPRLPRAWAAIESPKRFALCLGPAPRAREPVAGPSSTLAALGLEARGPQPVP